MRVHFEEKKKDLYQTDDGRFQMTKTQGPSGYKFTILDVRKNVRVGAPKSFTAANSLVRRYLLEEKQAEETPSTIPALKITDNTVPLGVEKKPQTSVNVPKVIKMPVLATPPKNEEPKNSQNSQIVMAHLASIADEEGMFSSYRSTIAKETGLAWTHIDYWLNKFITMKWVVELEPETEGNPGKYGFDLSSDEVQSLIQNMPKRIVTKSSKPEVPTESVPSQAGIMAGKAMVRIGDLEVRLNSFMKDIRNEIEGIKQELKSKEKMDAGEFESVLTFLEDSQQKVNTFIKDTFGVNIL